MFGSQIKANKTWTSTKIVLEQCRLGKRVIVISSKSEQQRQLEMLRQLGDGDFWFAIESTKDDLVFITPHYVGFN